MFRSKIKGTLAPGATARRRFFRPTVLALEDRLAPATLLHSLFPDPSVPQQGAKFGYAVAADTNFHVVGAPYSHVGDFASVGQAFVYNASTGALVATLNNPTPAAEDLFGYRVAVSGNTVVVGVAYGDNTGATDAGSAYVFDATTGALVATLNNPTPASGDGFGISVAVSGSTVVVGAWQDDTGATDAGSAYVFNASTGALVATLNNPTPANTDWFGYSVAVSGNTVVVGAHFDDTGATNAGSAYVFNATTGALVATLNNPTPALNDKFGTSVAASGSTVVVGANTDDTGATDAGSAYVFNTTTGALIATLNKPTPVQSDFFGNSVAISGTTVVVGAFLDDMGATNGGAAYVFNATNGALVATLNNPTPVQSDLFGNSVAVSGNTVVVGTSNGGAAYGFNATTGTLIGTLNNPTLAYDARFGNSVAVSGNTVVVGAFFDDTGADYTGSAYMFNATTGAPVATLNNPTPEFDDEFGISVAVSGNVIVVGAWDDNTGAPTSGSAYVFNATTGALVATLNNPTPANDDYFGYSVAVSGNTVVVGAYNDDTGATDAGSAYVFNATTGALVATLNNPNPDFDAEFGSSVAVSGNTVVVGAFQFLSGSAYVFDATTGALITTLNNPTPQSGDQFGSSVAVSGNTVVVGANSDNTGAPNAGSAYVFNASTGAFVATLNNPTPASDDYFGGSVAVSGNTAVVGARLDNTGATYAGSAYVFNATTGALVDTLNNPTPAFNDQFGVSVAVSGNTVVVGAVWDDTQNTDQGAAYVYSLDSGTVNPPVVTSVAPFVGPTTGGITVVINGAHFLGVTGAAGVQFGANNATSYTVDSDTKITAVLPAGNAGIVNVTVTNSGLTSSTAGTAADFQYIAPVAPQLLSVTPNDNLTTLAGDQRSRVASLVVAFDQAVQLDTGAMTLALHTSNVRLGGVLQPDGYGSLPTSLNLSTSDNTTWTVTFTGNTDIVADGFDSLKDGVYDFTIDAAKVHPMGDLGVNMAGDFTNTFHRLYGDTNAPTATPNAGGADFTSIVNTGDNLVFRGAFNKPVGGGYQPFLDFNGDGVINSGDNLQFRTRFNKSLTWRA
jgi:outer membrane protein assembly factor BamB